MNHVNNKPRVNCELILQNENLLAKNEFDEFTFQELPVDSQSAYDMLSDINGNMTISQLFDKWKTVIDEEKFTQFLKAMQESGLILKNNAAYMSGKSAMLKIEDEQHAWLHAILYKNIFWKALSNPGDVPKNVYLGMAIETYHLLSHGAVFDGPALSFHGARNVRKEMCDVFCEENGHHDIFLSALVAEGFIKEAIQNTVPLGETKGLINSLAYWSANDPIFFFSCMEIIEGKDNEVDSVVNAMEQSGVLSYEFVEKIKSHSLINIEKTHTSLGRRLLSGIEVVSQYDVDRAVRQTKLFIELYNAFYLAVWNYYSDVKNPVLRAL